MPRAFIGLGSNLQQPLQQVRTATEMLRRLPQTTLWQASSFYRTSPLDATDQPDFINRVVALDTQLTAEQLLTELQRIEQQLGRVRLKRWGPRVIDCDLLLYGEEIIATERLTVPHADLKQRAFVLYPLAEIAPDLILPSGEAVAQLKIQCPALNIQLLGDDPL